MNKEQLEKLSDFDINSLIISKLEIESDVHFGGGAITRHVNNGEVLRCTETLDYCSNPSDMMPLVFEAGINLSPISNDDIECGTSSLTGDWWAGANNYGEDNECGLTSEFYTANSDNPLRAAAIVYLLMRGEQ